MGKFLWVSLLSVWIALVLFIQTEFVAAGVQIPHVIDTAATVIMGCLIGFPAGYYRKRTIVIVWYSILFVLRAPAFILMVASAAVSKAMIAYDAALTRINSKLMTAKDGRCHD